LASPPTSTTGDVEFKRGSAASMPCGSRRDPTCLRVRGFILIDGNSARHSEQNYELFGLRGNHTIATFMFCAIEPLVGDTQKFVKGVSIASELRHPDTDGDDDRRSASDLECTVFDG
jgi:hypothetical protein